MKTSKEHKEWTLAEAFENVALKMFDGGLNEKAMEKVKDATNYVNYLLGVSPVQCVILSVLLQKLGETVTTKYLAEYLGTTTVRMLGVQWEIDELVGKRMVECTKESGFRQWSQTLVASDGLVQAVRYNRPFEEIRLEGMSARQILDMLQTLMHEFNEDEMEYRDLERQMLYVMQRAQHVDFCQRIKAYDLPKMETAALLMVCAKFLADGKENLAEGDSEDKLPPHALKFLLYSVRNNRGPISELKLLSLGENGEGLVMTNKAKREMLGEFGYKGLPEDDEPKVCKAEPQCEIVEKKLFYNKSEGEMIERLTSLLEPSNLVRVQARLRAAGMRQGFTVIMHGQPGTGKTESVLQIARRTGREIMQVNLANLKDHYLGESEKNVQRIFDNYNEKLKTCDNIPILLFNEADGIFGKRLERIDSEVDQMENTIQNIILQNMETFQGILIATTNLTQNLDKAFERRFLYKIEFHKPSREVRQKIWMSMMPSISASEANTLATRYELSGGQIENITRKQTIESVLYDTPVSLEMLCTLCEEECFHKRPSNVFRTQKAV